MKRSLLFSLLFFLSFTISAQESLMVKKEGQLDGMSIGYNDVWGYVGSNGDEFAIIGGLNSINVVNVTDCTDPVLVHQWVDGSNTTWRDFKDYGGYIYAVCDGGGCNEGLQVISKSDYSNSQSTADFLRAHNIYVDKDAGRLYVTGTNSTNKGLIVYDVATDPGNPILLKKVDFQAVTGTSLNFYVHDVFVKDNIAYCSHGYQGFGIWDMTDLEDVELLGTLDTGGYNHSSWLSKDENYIYCAEELPLGRPIIIIDVSDLTSPNIVGTFKDPLLAPEHTENRPHNPFVLEDYLYISYYHDGFQMYDVSDPEDPVQVAYYDTHPQNTTYTNNYPGAWGTYPFLPSGCILVSNREDGLYTLRSMLTPKKAIKIENGDVIITDDETGFVFKNMDDEYYRLRMDTDGTLYTELQTAPTDISMRVSQANLYIPDNIYGIIFNTAENTNYKINVDDAGALSTSLVTPATQAITMDNENTYIVNYNAGLILKSSSGRCWLLSVGNDGQLTTGEIECPD